MPQSKKRSPLTKEARMRGVRSKKERAIFNKYLRAVTNMGSKKVQQLRDRIEEAEATLRRGTHDKCSPLFDDGIRIGSTRKMLPLLHADRAALLTQIAQHKAQLKKMALSRNPELRVKFLEILPNFALRNGHTREILLLTGVPEADLDQAGITE